MKIIIVLSLLSSVSVFAMPESDTYFNPSTRKVEDRPSILVHEQDRCDGAMKILEDISTQQGLNIANMSSQRSIDPSSEETLLANEKIAEYKYTIKKAKENVRNNCSF